jgi:UDP-glucose 4-epimerase
LNSCVAAGVRSLVVMSCARVYGALNDNPHYMTELWPLRGNPGEFHVREKLEIESMIHRFAAKHPKIATIVVRPAHLIGSGSRNCLAFCLEGTPVPVVMGFDPLIQFLHERDCLAALTLLLDHQESDVFNLAPDDAIPLRKLIRLAGGAPVSLPRMILAPATEVLWNFRLSEKSADFLDLLTFSCTISGAKFIDRFGFRLEYGTEEALKDFIAGRKVPEADEISDDEAPSHNL